MPKCCISLFNNDKIKFENKEELDKFIFDNCRMKVSKRYSRSKFLINHYYWYLYYNDILINDIVIFDAENCMDGDSYYYISSNNNHKKQYVNFPILFSINKDYNDISMLHYNLLLKVFSHDRIARDSWKNRKEMMKYYNWKSIPFDDYNNIYSKNEYAFTTKEIQEMNLDKFELIMNGKN